MDFSFWYSNLICQYSKPYIKNTGVGKKQNLYSTWKDGKITEVNKPIKSNSVFRFLGKPVYLSFFVLED